MNGDDSRQNERQSLLTRLLDAVKQCQVRFGGRSELATDSDSRVSCLCATWEAVLQHGIKKNNKALSALRHVTERAGLGKVTDFFSEVKHFDSEPAFWHYVKEHLTKHEVQRFNALKQINTDMGRGRAWLRACLNEHSLERYMHMLIEKEDIVGHYYHDWAFMCDQERNSMLPTMSAGLGSILFAITIDRPELNKAYQNAVHISNGGEVTKTASSEEEPRAVIAGDASPSVKKKDKRKRKKVANVVSFEEDDSTELRSRRHSSVTSAGSGTTADDRDTGVIPPHLDNSTSHSGNQVTEPRADSQEPYSEPVQTGDDSLVKSSESNPALADGTIKNGQASDDTEESQERTTESDKMTDNSQGTSLTPEQAADLPLPHVTNSRQQSGSDSSREQRGSEGSSDKVKAMLEAQISVTSTTSVFSAASVDMSSNVSKSSTGSITSFDGDIGNCILTLVADTGLHDDVTHMSHASSFTPDIHSDASSELSVFSSGDVNSAALALAVAQKGLESARTDGDGRISDLLSEHSHQYMSHEELRQAVVAMMVKKDEVEEQCRGMQALLDQEMDTSAMLRADIADLKQVHQLQQESDQAKTDKLQSENELLKHQLKKYVNAVQLLRSEGASSKDDGLGIRLDDCQPSMPPAKSNIDYSHEASEYEQKLIQVAEMHGELMEFNEMLHRQLNAKDAVLRQLRQELVTLRGPLPYDEHQMEESATALMESLSIQSRTLINIWIPSAFLRGTSSDQYHVYQVYVRIRDEEWNVFRRYSQFLDLHTRLKKVYPIVSKFDFPPKKSMGSKEAKVVEGRRQTFQKYLRNVINMLQEKNPELNSDTCKSKLISLLPFFGDNPEAGSKKGRKKSQQQHQQQGAASRLQSAASAPSTVGRGAAAGAQYQGL